MELHRSLPGISYIFVIAEEKLGPFSLNALDHFEKAVYLRLAHVSLKDDFRELVVIVAVERLLRLIEMLEQLCGRWHLGAFSLIFVE